MAALQIIYSQVDFILICLNVFCLDLQLQFQDAVGENYQFEINFNIHYSISSHLIIWPIKISRALGGPISLIHCLISPNLQGSLNTNFNTFPDKLVD